MELVPRLSIDPLSNTFSKSPMLTYSAKTHANTANKLGTSLPMTTHDFSDVNSKLTFSIFDTLKMAEEKMDTLFHFLFSGESTSQRTSFLPWERNSILGAYYAFEKLTSRDSSSCFDNTWLDKIAEFNECIYKKKNCPRILEGVTIFSWGHDYMMFFPDLMCLLSR